MFIFYEQTGMIDYSKKDEKNKAKHFKQFTKFENDIRNYNAVD
jgi:hypothetical protein